MNKFKQKRVNKPPNETEIIGSAFSIHKFNCYSTVNFQVKFGK